MKNNTRNIFLLIVLFGCATKNQSDTEECINFDDLELVNDNFLFRKTLFNGCAQKVQGKYTIELQFADGKKHGYVKQFENNFLIEEGNFQDGFLEGSFTTFYPNGNVKSITLYKKGLKEGKEEIFWESGEIGHVYHYSQNQLVDTSYSYSKNGNVLARRINLGGFGNSEVINYLDSTQNTFMSGSMRNGNSIGDWLYKFTPDSCLVRHYNGGSYTQTPCDCDTLSVPKI